MIRKIRYVAIAAVIALPQMVLAQAATDMAVAFGMRESVSQISLSPDGTKVAIVAPQGDTGSRLEIANLATGAPPSIILQGNGKPDRLSNCRWASNTRLLCTVFGVVPVDNEIGYVTRVLAVDANGQNMKVLNLTRGGGDALGYGLYGGSVIDWHPGVDDSVLMMRQYVPEKTTGSHMAQTSSGIGVDLVNTTTLRTQLRETPRDDVEEYITDGVGNIRIMGRRVTDGGYDGKELRYLFRRKGSREWQLLSSLSGETATGFDPSAVDGDKDIAYGLMRDNGRRAAYTMSLDGKGTLTQLFSHPQVDVSGFVRVGRKGRIIGVRYQTDRPEVKYLDADLEKLAGSLAKALPESPLVRFIDSSEDETKMLLWAGSDTNPGRYYLFDRTARKLNEILLDRPQLENAKLATMRAITFPAADGTIIPGYLTLPPGSTGKGLPAIVMPHGGPASRDSWGFDWLGQYFASQGFAVLQPNYRGSSGYGDSFYLKNGFKSWKTAIGDVTDAGRWMIAQGIADPKKLAIFGWSYGGYAALQSAVVAPDLFKAAVAVAPVTDFNQLKEERRGWSDYLLVSNMIGTGPHVAEGSPARRVTEIRIPVLMFHGKLDRNVRSAQSVTMDERLRAAGKKSELVLYPELDHYLEDSNVRTQMLKKSSDFIKVAIGP